MSDQAREDVYKKSWVYRRNQGISWKNDGISLDDRKKRLS